MTSVGEGSGSLKVCATLLSIEDTERDFVVALVTSDGTGKKLVLASYKLEYRPKWFSLNMNVVRKGWS